MTSVFEWFDKMYNLGIIKLEQCKRAVENNKLTKEEYKIITKLDFEN